MHIAHLIFNRLLRKGNVLGYAVFTKVQQLQFFLSESIWDASALANHTVGLLMNEPVTTPTDDGVLLLDDTGDRKKGSALITSGANILARSARWTTALSG
jgi:hypothetical protein